MKHIAIIGGSYGITEKLAEKLLQNQYTVSTISRSETNINGVTHYQLDVLKDPLPTFEKLDGLVYGPGSITLKPFGKLTEEDFQNDYSINVIGAVRALQHYYPALKASGLASVVLFSSVAAQRGMPFHASISAAKAAIEGLAKSLAAEWAPSVRVNTIAPSITDTPLGKSVLRNDKVVENMIQKHPLKRILSAQDVANTAAFLLSNDSLGMSGQIIIQDNGLISMQL